MRNLVLALAVTACLTGCDRMKAAFTPIPERVTAAFPLPDETELARARLVAALEGDKRAEDAVNSQLAQLMNARALACTASAPVGRFDTVQRIRGRVADVQCFTRQDAQLDEWIALRRIALILRAPALVPAAPLPARALLPNTIENFSSVHLAAQANVLVLRNYQGKAQALQVPAGKEIASFSVEGSGRPSLSPNGRLLAVPGVKMLRVADVESGKVLWTSDKYQDVVGWAPQWDLVVLAQAGTGAPFMLDTRSGRMEPYPATEKRLTWSLPAGEAQLLVGHSTSASLMQHGRDASGKLEAHPVSQWTLPNGIGLPSPFLMNQGKRLVYPTYRELAWLDLATGQQGSWQLAALGASNYVQVADNVVAFDVASAEGTPVTKLLDTEKATLANAKQVMDRGQAFPLTPRAGFLRRGANAVAVTASLDSDEPQDAERVIGEALAAREIAKLNDPYRADFGTGASERTPERQAYIDALSKRVRAMNAQSAIRDGLSRETVEAIRRGQRPTVVGSASPSSGAGAVPIVGKTILDVPPESRIAMIGVYEPAGSSHSSSRAGNVTITVGPGKAPLVLVLSSYEAVNWMIHAGDRKIVAVLVSGYKPSNVYGQGNAQVLRIGSQHAYKIDSPAFGELRREVARYVGNTTPIFQGAYQGTSFMVN